MARRLVVDGQVVPLPYRAALCLDVLIDADGSPVSRERLFERAWQGAVVEDSNLSHSILALRKALDRPDDTTSHIETVPRVGYRLARPTHRLVPLAGAEASQAAPESMSPHEAPPSGVPAPPVERPTARARRWLLAAAALTLLLTSPSLRMVSGGSHPTAFEEANRLVDEGLRLVRRGKVPDAAEAAHLFEQALTHQPNSPRARAAMAESAARYGKPPFDLAISMAEDAAAADPACMECVAIRGYVVMTRGWRWAEAGPLLDRALSALPAHNTLHIWKSLWLTVHGRFDAAIAAAERAVALEPTNGVPRAQLAAALYFAGRFDEAVRRSEEATQLAPDLSSAYYWRLRSQMMLGRDDEMTWSLAHEAVTWGGQMSQAMTFREPFRAALQVGGRRGLADFWLSQVSNGDALKAQRYDRAVWLAWTGRHDEALLELEAGLASRPYRMIFAAVDPIFERVRVNPRFDAVRHALGLDTAVLASR